MEKEANWLECPVCEYRFSVPSDYLNKSGKCPKCENVFLASECQLPEKELVGEMKEPPIPAPAALANLEGFNASKSSSTPPVQPPAHPPKSPGKEQGVTPDVDQTFVTADKKRTDPNKVLIWVSASCLIAIALLIGIPAFASWMVKDDGDTDVAINTTANEVESSGKEGDVKNRKGKKRNGKNKTKRGKGKKKKPSKVVKNFTPEELRTIWGDCYSGVALIVSKYGEENRTSHGVVVSKNGMIAVKLSNIRGADSVRVKIALPEYGVEDRWTKPVEATLLVNSKPELDLAIIQIDQNTKPVSGRSLPIQDGERGVIPVLSNKNSEEYLRLTRLRPAEPFEDLTTEQQESISEQQIRPAANDYFVVHSAKLNKSGMGAPVFDESGQWIGMHVAHHEESKSSFLIPPASVLKVMNDPLKKPIELAVFAKRSDAANPQNPTSPDRPQNFASALKQMGEQEWKLDPIANYQTACAFAEQWWNVNEEYRTADFTRRLKIEEMKKQMDLEMEEKLFWPSTEERTHVNEHALKVFRDREKGWVACVTVLKPAGLAQDVDDEPAILVQLANSSERALLVPGEVEGPFIQGTEWVVFGVNKDNTRLNTADGKCLVIHLSGVHKK